MRSSPAVAYALVATLSCVPALLPSAARGGRAEEIQCGEVLQSSLDSEDTDLGDGTWLESYAFTIDRLSIVSALMTSDGFEPYVLITDGELVTQHEGEPPLVVALAPGTYRLFANNLTVLPDGDYPYTLSLSCSTREVEAISCDQTVAGQLDPTDEGFFLDTWIDQYRVTIEAPSRVRFELDTESFDPVVILRDSDGTDLGSGSGVYANDLPAGEYIVLANNFVLLPDSDAYPYRLSMSCRAVGCPGDCDSDGQVSIDELIRGVRIALGASDQSCSAFDTDGDEEVTVSELIRAVRAALEGCP